MRIVKTLLIVLLTSPVAAADVSGTVSGTVRVIDGDTIDVGGVRVRLHGIDAPERDQTCSTEQGVEWKCGAWVAAQVKDRFDGTRAACTTRDIDRYGRTVATCSVTHQDMGQLIVSEGWAFAYRRYSMEYDLDEKRAAVTGRGLHAMRVQSPSEFRRAGAVSQAPERPSCPIKGNISSKGERIYHQPGQMDYDRTRIRADKGERWFCSSREAEAAGWRAARR